jgi:predicted peptidase
MTHNIFALPRPAAIILIAAACLQPGCSHRPTNQPAKIHHAAETTQTMKNSIVGQKLRYIMQPPAGTKPKAGWPLMLFLHGYGECGNDIQIVKKHGPPKLIDKFDSLSTCVIVSPQCPKNSWWRTDALKALVDQVIAERRDIDTTRLYITGLSMGGYGTWSFVSRHPNYFAAAVPICGGGDPFALPSNRPGSKIGITNEFDPKGLKRAKDLPIWAFHGAKDGSVPIKETKILVESLKAAGSTKVKFTAYKDAGHVAAWQKAYNDPELWKWFFLQEIAQKKQN